VQMTGASIYENFLQRERARLEVLSGQAEVGA